MIIKKKRKKKTKHFRRLGQVYFRHTVLETIKVKCVNIDNFISYEDMSNYLKSLNEELPLCVIGDCRFMPLPLKIFRYYLTYNPDNFIGEEITSLYGDNAYIVFHLNYPEDYDKIKNIAQRIIYLGSSVHILLICYGEAVLSQYRIRKERLDDYHIILLKDTNIYLPHHKKLKIFDYKIPKKL